MAFSPNATRFEGFLKQLGNFEVSEPIIEKTEKGRGYTWRLYLNGKDIGRYVELGNRDEITDIFLFATISGYEGIVNLHYTTNDHKRLDRYTSIPFP